MVPQGEWAAGAVAGVGTTATRHKCFLSLLWSCLLFTYNTHGLRRGLYSCAALRLAFVAANDTGSGCYHS